MKEQTIKNKDNVTVYPQTHTQAVYDANGKKLQDWMNEYYSICQILYSVTIVRKIIDFV